jgi:hypothetical protein
MRRLLRLLCLTAAAETRNAGHPARAAEARTWITAPEGGRLPAPWPERGSAAAHSC